VIAAGFFLAARQHFMSMDYGFKNSKLKKQLEDLEAEKRRLVLAREVSLSPTELRKAASRAASIRAAAQKAEAVPAAAVKSDVKPDEAKLSGVSAAVVKPVRAAFETSGKADESEHRAGLAEPVRDKRDGVEIAAVAKLR
jgi:hypothetical protein